MLLSMHYSGRSSHFLLQPPNRRFELGPGLGKVDNGAVRVFIVHFEFLVSCTVASDLSGEHEAAETHECVAKAREDDHTRLPIFGADPDCFEHQRERVSDSRLGNRPFGGAAEQDPPPNGVGSRRARTASSTSSAAGGVPSESHFGCFKPSESMT